MAVHPRGPAAQHERSRAVGLDDDHRDRSPLALAVVDLAALVAGEMADDPLPQRGVELEHAVPD